MSAWGEVEVADTRRRRPRFAATDYAARLRDLNRRHRMSPDDPDKFAPLTPEEHQERKHLTNWTKDLHERWNNLEPMSPEETEAHRNLFGGELHKEPEKMGTRDRADYFGHLHDQVTNFPDDPLTPRQQVHYETMKPWAAQHFDGIHQNAKAELAQWQEHEQNPPRSLMGTPRAHDPAHGVQWAHEELNNANPYFENPVLKQRAQDYRGALEKTVAEGPLASGGLKLHHEALEDSRNAMRVELQHHGRFKVPSTDHLSPVGDPSEQHARGDVVNPRFGTKLGVIPVMARESDGAGEAAENSYKVNCQRCVLAAEARHRGHNVEAQRNFQLPKFTNPSSDKDFSDHQIAQWFPHADGSTPRWQDAEDVFRDIPHGPEHWDAMTDHIAGQGPGARGVVAMAVPHPAGQDTVDRHVINYQVHDDGKVRYYDAQSGEHDVGEQYRNALAYGRRSEYRQYRDVAPEGFSPEQATRRANDLHSPLRFLRTDDKELHPETAQHMVDRGTATDTAIYAKPTPKPAPTY